MPELVIRMFHFLDRRLIWQVGTRTRPRLIGTPDEMVVHSVQDSVRGTHIHSLIEYVYGIWFVYFI